MALIKYSINRMDCRAQRFAPDAIVQIDMEKRMRRAMHEGVGLTKFME